MMTPVKQTRFTKGDGNCFNACVASLLDVPLEHVDVIWNEQNWLKQLDELIHPLGYCFVEWDWNNDAKPWHWVGNCYMIASGDGPRGCKHSVIVHHYIDDAGMHCVVNHHDPHPSDAFLKTIDYVGVLFPHWEPSSNTKAEGGLPVPSRALLEMKEKHMEAFETWVYSGIRYVAVPNGNGGSSVIAQTGEHYGSWMDVDGFRKRQAKGEDESLVLGRAELRVVNISNAEHQRRL